jgi:hypothetical protein
VQHADVIGAAARETRVLVRWKESERSLPFAHEDRHVVPHAFVQMLEAEDVDIPLHRLLHIANRQCNVIDPFQREHARDSAKAAAAGQAGLC